MFNVDYLVRTTREQNFRIKISKWWSMTPLVPRGDLEESITGRGVTAA